MKEQYSTQLFGCQRLLPSKKRRKIETYLQKVVQPHIPLLPYDEAAATWHAGERTRERSSR